MSRIYFDAYCPACESSVRILEGNPMVCPECSAGIEVKSITLGEYLGIKETQNSIPASKGKEIE